MAIVNGLLNAHEYKKAIYILNEILESKFSDKQVIYSCLGKVFIQVRIVH
jgi:pentatricopeptide repeat protein